MNQRMPLGEKSDSYSHGQLLFALLRCFLPLLRNREYEVDRSWSRRPKRWRVMGRTPHQIAAHKAENEGTPPDPRFISETFKRGAGNRTSGFHPLAKRNRQGGRRESQILSR